MKIQINGIKALNGNTPEVELQDLMIFFGENNCGKTSVILGICHYFWLNGHTTSDYITPNRLFIGDDYPSAPDNVQEAETMHRKNRMGAGYPENNPPDTIAEMMFLTPEARKRVINWFNENFEEFKIHKKELDEFTSKPEVLINNLRPSFQGSGARAALPIVVLLHNPNIEYLSIDEPELSLEPKAQKKLFDLIKKASKGEDGLPKKKIFVATHNHLFLDKEEITNNFKIIKTNNQVQFNRIEKPEELHEAVYTLLGSNPTDLFFPGNIVLVEGRSDKIFLEKILELLITSDSCIPKKIVFHFIDGYEKAEIATQGIIQMLKTQSYTPVYLDRICGIFDSPQQKKKLIEEIRSFVHDDKKERFVLLDKEAIEYYYPLSIIKDLFNKSALKQEEYEAELANYLKTTKKKETKGKGTIWGKEISKPDFAKEVSKKLNSLDEVDPIIVNLLLKSAELSF